MTDEKKVEPTQATPSTSPTPNKSTQPTQGAAPATPPKTA